MLTTLAAAIIFSAQAQGASIQSVLDQKADFKYPILSVTALGQELSKHAGVTIQVTPELEATSVYVNVRDKSLREVLDLVARATTTEWVQANGVISIRRTPVQTAAERKRFTQFRLEAARNQWQKNRPQQISAESMAKAMKEAADLAANMGENWDYAKYAKLQQLDAYAPAQIIGQEVVEALGLETLVGLNQGERIVFSTQPTRLQRPLPARMQGVVARFNALREMAEQASKAANVSNEDMRYYSALLNRNNFDPDAPPRKVASIHVVLTSGEFEGMGSRVAVKGYDADGNVVEQSNVDAGLQGFSSDAPNMDALKEFTDMVTLPPDVAERSTLMNKLFQRKLDAADRAKLLPLLAEGRLMKNQPSVLSAVLDYWVSKKGDLVIEAPNVFFPAQEAVFDPKQVLAYLVDPRSLALEKVGDVTVGVAQTSLTRDSVWMDEGSLSLMAKAILAKGKLDFEDMADVAAQSKSDQMMVQMGMYASMLEGNTEGSPYTWQGGMALRAYGLLSRAERKRVRETGMTWNIGALPAKLRPVVEKELEKGEVYPGSSGWESDMDWEAESESRSQDEYVSAYEQEPTVFLTLAKAQPMVFSLSMKSSRRVLQNTLHQGQYSNVEWKLPKQIGQQMAMNELAAKQGQDFGGNNPTTYAEVTKGELVAQFKFGKLPEAKLTYSYVQEEKYKFGPLTSLSKEVQATIQAAYKKALEDYKDVTFGGPGGGATPPPPPSR